MRAFVLVTALPPTLGHLHLIQFAQSLAPTTVIVSTQPSEPYAELRYDAIASAADNAGVDVFWFHKTIEQNPEAPGFWDMWRDIFDDYLFQPGDYIVASEPYGLKLAQELGGRFMPYDLDRSIYPSKATYVRNRPVELFTTMIPEFRKHFMSRVTLFGAESCGKTTLSRELASFYRAPWLFEWARPYLETVGPDITTESMTAIWQGQRALQQSAGSMDEYPVIFQDTDLFSTVGYWDFWDMNTPEALRLDASDLRSDLYIITPSNIPFEEDPIRYGGDRRESDDQYWIDLCERYDLNYRVLTTNTVASRVAEATGYIDALLTERLNMRYERKHND